MLAQPSALFVPWENTRAPEALPFSNLEVRSPEHHFQFPCGTPRKWWRRYLDLQQQLPMLQQYRWSKCGSGCLHGTVSLHSDSAFLPGELRMKTLRAWSRYSLRAEARTSTNRAESTSILLMRRLRLRLLKRRSIVERAHRALSIQAYTQATDSPIK